MRTTEKRKKRRKEGRPIDSAARRAATDEILQVMYWLRGENIAQEVGSHDLSKWIGLGATEIEPILIEMLGARLVERVVVDSGVQEGLPRFRLTSAGVHDGGRRFADEFADLTKPHHFEHSDSDCDCDSLSRFSVSLKKNLFRRLDDMIKEKGYGNRSLAIADMIRAQLVEHRRGVGRFEAVGTIFFAVDPRDAHTHAACSELQKRYLDIIVASLRVPIDVRSCMEVLVVRGRASRIKALASRVIAAKGVKNGKLSIAGAVNDLA